MIASVAVANKKYIRWDDNGQHLSKLLFQKDNSHLPNDQKEQSETKIEIQNNNGIATRLHGWYKIQKNKK